MTLYALNLFDLADNDLYVQYSRRSPEAVAKHGGRVVALGLLDDTLAGDAEPRRVMILVEWPSRESFRAFLDDPELTDLHPLREGGTRNYLWWTYERLEDLRPLFRGGEKGE
jgi:uncharacterized protein (DUF1330 family)